MAKVTMDFWRDEHTGPACLEYSYVPEGKRRTIQLRPGQQEAIQADTVPDDLKPSHVQVYTLTNNDTVSLDMWQFPPGPPHVLPVMGAQVSVLQKRMVTAGMVTYSDETVNSGSAPLDPFPRPCPQGRRAAEPFAAADRPRD
jgi:hypothetical protein